MFLRISLSLALLGYILWIIPLAKLASAFHEIRWNLFPVIGAIFVLPVFLSTIRWKLLLSLQGTRRSFRECLWYSWVGMFFNNFLLGFLGGDVVKAYLASRGTDRPVGNVTSVVSDRVAGLFGLVLVGALGAVAAFGRQELRAVSWLAFGLLAAVVVGWWIYFHPRIRELGWVRRLVKRLPFSDTRAKVDQAVQMVRGDRRILAIALGLSVAIHLISLGAWYGMSQVVGIGNAQWTDFYVLLPPVLILVALPISISGWGWGDAAAIHFFRMVGYLDEKTEWLVLLCRFSFILISLPGGVLFLRDPARRAKGAARATAEGHVAGSSPVSYNQSDEGEPA